jgi:outer membrane protein
MNKLLLVCLLVFAPVSLASADLKVAVVDLSKAFDSYYKTKDAQARIQVKEDAFKKEYQDLQTDYDHLGQEAQKLNDASKDQTLSPDARKDKAAALQAKVQDLQNMGRKIEEMRVERTREIQDELVRRHKEIVDEIAKVINDYSGPQGFDIVIDKSSASAASGVPIVLYNSSKLIDITADIIKQLNAMAPPPTAGGGAAPGAPAPSGAAPAAPH